MESFLGTINYCGKFVQNVTKDTAYLYGLMRKKVNYDWSKVEKDEKLISAVQALKDRVGNAHTLAVPKGSGRFIITTDASDLGIGAIFSQEQDGVERVISYYSKAHSKAERNYSTTEKELLAVIKTLQNFRPYLLCRKFLLRTDHMAIKWLFSSRNMKGRLARWSLSVQEYDMEIEHVRGQVNPSDSLSRMSLKTCQVHTEQKVNLEKAHLDMGHASVKTMEYKYGKQGIAGLREKLEQILKKCGICQRAGLGYRRGYIIPTKSKDINDLWELDLVGPLPINRRGQRYILTMIDHYSKRGDVRPLYTKEAGGGPGSN
ncbi:Retrovirus-related Pol polyprotein from transposon 17.6 [Nosema granulosis]|uniref:Retrovirus-related Pol polyprotein from transposon 17.6 n=1 Tax=Nosema granulosis TaxID=83296 RepID=A0A9P6GWZ1_9MICR|nr:Retrovirus-related Pol polyprotein from transposon 17.6 [Nosema granulosis]